MLKYLLIWLSMPFLAIFNGALRQIFLVKSIGDKTAQKVSVFTLILLLGIYIGVMLTKWPLESLSQAIWVGINWFILTLLFEFIMVLVVLKKPLLEALNSYNIFNGELWPLVLLFVLLIPIVIYKIQ